MSRADSKRVIEQQEASLQRIALWIVSLPRGNRAAAISLARKVFEETFQQASLNPDLARKWVDLNTERLHALLPDMEAGGVGGHA